MDSSPSTIYPSPNPSVVSVTSTSASTTSHPAPSAASVASASTTAAPEEQLDSTQVVEIEKFVLKKVWIDEKIAVLSNLPVIKPFEPLPPELSSVGKEEFERWWEEHMSVETEITDYDKGDFEGLRKLALAASKRNLSPKDTDLIDITLTTVFALDKLLHLLKDRRVRLDSLKLRLKWESEIVAYRNELAALFKVDIPKYLSKARWVKPVESDVGRGRADSLSLSKSVSGKRRTSQGSSRLSMFMNPNNSSEENLANALAIGNGRPSSQNSTWIPSRSVSTNAPSRPTSMSRQLIADSISLSLSPLTSRLTSINNTLVPATGKTLDAMIAKSRLPDQFFDVQDEIEDVAPKEVAGVGSFLNEVVHQWRKADEVWWNCDRLKDESAEVQRNVEEWIKKDIDEDLLRKWESGCRDMRKRLAQTKSIMDSSKAGGLPLPIHLKFSDQVSKNFELVQTLNLQIDETSDDLRKMEEKVAEYRFAVESIKRGQRIRKTVEELRRGIEANRAELKAEVEDRTKDGRPDLEQTSNDKMPWTSYGGKSEDAYLARVKKLQDSLKSQISTTSGLQNEVSLILRDLIKAGVDPNLRRDLRDAGDSLQDRAKESQAEMDRWFAWYNTLVAEGRKTWKECEERRNELELAEKEWQSRSERARWVENDQSKQQPVDQASDEKRLAAMLERIDTSCLPIRAYFPSLYAPDLSASNTKAAVPRSLFAAHSYTHVPPFFQAIEAIGSDAREVG
ncbi:hypothetical protein BT69DRAFT_1141173 [Atractiella rhizophila]|nr:hypothetical protein BT69DRAFT_1141173 [Atractiella rhizophila]